MPILKEAAKININQFPAINWDLNLDFPQLSCTHLRKVVADAALVHNVSLNRTSRKAVEEYMAERSRRAAAGRAQLLAN